MHKHAQVDKDKFTEAYLKLLDYVNTNEDTWEMKYDKIFKDPCFVLGDIIQHGLINPIASPLLSYKGEVLRLVEVCQYKMDYVNNVTPKGA